MILYKLENMADSLATLLVSLDLCSLTVLSYQTHDRISTCRGSISSIERFDSRKEQIAGTAPLALFAIFSSLYECVGASNTNTETRCFM